MTRQRHSSDEGPLGIDAQLRKALDHAPDARLEPPAALDDAILRVANLAARTANHQAPSTSAAESQGLGTRVRAWWRRPTAVPALAVLVLATVVVSIWTHQPIPAALKESQRPEVPTRVLETGAGAATAAAPDSAASPSSVARGADATVASPPPAPPALKRARDEVVTPKAKVQLERQQTAANAPTTPTPTTPITPAPSEAKSSLRESAAEAIAQARPEPPASTTALPRVPVVAAPAAPDAPAASAAPAAPPAPAAAFNVQGAGAASPSADTARRVRAVETNPSDRLLQIVGNSVRWSWRQDRSQQNTAIDADTSQWLTRLARVTTGRWARLTTMTDSANAASTATPVELWQLHELRITIIVSDMGVDWIDRDGSSWRATLSPDEVTELRR